jgi:ABC-type Fe3+ transport system substrate-binding protein
LLLSLLLVACAPARSAAPSGQAPAGSSAAAPGPASSAPAPSGTGAGASWEAVVRGARQEGQLAIGGPVGQEWRDALLSFAQDYPEIQLDFVGLSTGNFWPRIEKERTADQFLWDVQVGGAGADSFEARDRGLIDPVRPLLALPEVVDESKWLGGIDGVFLDKDRQYLLGFLANVQNNVFVNRELIPETELRSAKDLLDPRWKGRIAAHDAREAGAGNAMFAVLLTSYGEPFVRDLLTRQDLTVTADYRQLTEWAVRGRYPIIIGSSLDFLAPFRAEGLGQNVVPLTDPLTVSSGNGALKLVNRAPHPNAAKLFVNWLLTRETQVRVTGLVRYNSRRLDVPPVSPVTAADPARLRDYVSDQFEDIVPVKQRAGVLARELLP